jgi:hypothetical protein
MGDSMLAPPAPPPPPPPPAAAAPALTPRAITPDAAAVAADPRALLSPAAAAGGAAQGGAAAAAVQSEEGARQAVLADVATMCGIMTRRLNNLRVLQTQWARGNVRGAIELLGRMDDLPTAADFLAAAEAQFQTTNNLLSLDICRDLQPVLTQLLTSPFEEYVHVALRYLKLLLRAFAVVVKETRKAVSVGTNVELEERRERCNAIFENFRLAYERAQPVAKKPRAVGAEARELLSMLSVMLDVS